jgi:hypothetical protein
VPLALEQRGRISHRLQQSPFFHAPCVPRRVREKRADGGQDRDQGHSPEREAPVLLGLQHRQRELGVERGLRAREGGRRRSWRGCIAAR